MAEFGRGTPFRLERVLEQRRRLTETAQQALAERARERAEAEESLEELQREREGLTAYLEGRLRGRSLDLTALQAAEAYEGSLRTSAERQAEVAAGAHEREAAALAELLTCRVDQRVLEKLRERRLTALEERERQAESRLLDEIATTHRSAAALDPDGARRGV